MIGRIRQWFATQAEAAERLEKAAQSLDRSIGKLDQIVGQAMKEQVDEVKEKSAGLRNDFDRIRTS